MGNHHYFCDVGKYVIQLEIIIARPESERDL